MSDGIPFRSRHDLQWQIVLVDPRLLRAVQRRLRSSGPSHAIELALELALRAGRTYQTRPKKPTAVH